jgi:hypothetical protein
MPNDAPDWSTVIATPAIDLGAFTVNANAVTTVYNGPVPAGTHALKVFVKGTDARGNAFSVTVIDPSDGTVIQTFTSPKSTNLVTAVDDVTTPNIRVDVHAFSGSASTGRVVAFLSDQAVTVDNDPNTAVPVTLGGVAVNIATAAPVAVVGAVAAGASLVLPSVVNTRTYISSMTVGFNPVTGGGSFLSVNDSIGGLIWQAFVGPQTTHIPFPMPLAGNVNGILTVAFTGGGAGVTGALSVTYSSGP